MSESGFWEDLADEMEQPGFAAAYIEALDLIQNLDGIANATLDAENAPQPEG